MRSLALATLTLMVLAGCSSADPVTSPSPQAPVVTASPTPTPQVAPDVPRTSSSLADLQRETPVAPVGLVIDDINLDMDILPVGVADDGQMEIPTSANDAGWYRFGAAPLSATGNVVIAAHVDDGQVGLGPFHRLRDLNEDDRVMVTLEDGTEVEYRVTRKEQTSKQEVDMDVVFAKTDSQMLVLVTCGGEFDRNTRHYVDNVVVWAEPLGGPT